MSTEPSVRICRMAGEAFSPIRNEIQRFVSMIILAGLSCIVKFLPYEFAFAVNLFLRNLVGVEQSQQLIDLCLEDALPDAAGFRCLFFAERPTHRPNHLLEPSQLGVRNLQCHCCHSVLILGFCLQRYDKK